MAKNDMDLVDAFNDCVDRLNAGESLEKCLGDYPQFAERLRPLLGTGQLVTRAHQLPGAEVYEDRRKIREQVLREARQFRPYPPGGFVTSRRINLFYPLVGLASVGLVAVIALALIGPAIGNVFSNLVKNYAPNSYPYPVSTAVIAQQATATVALSPIITMTEPPVILLPRDMTSDPNATPLVRIMTATPQPTTTPPPTATAQVAGIVPTSVVQMMPQSLPTLVNDNAVALTATALNIILAPAGTLAPTLAFPTALAGATMPPGFATPTPPPFPTANQTITPLNAGEIDDNARWDTYLQYRGNFLQQYSATVHNVEVSGRQIITVTDRQGLPVLGARVLVFNGQTLLSETHTYANGQTLFFPYANPQGQGAQSYRVQVEYNGASVQFNLDPARGSLWDVVLDTSNRPVSPAKLDVLFLLDATGSMADEIAQLQNNILAISNQIAALSANNVDVRYGLVAYRDRDDAYIDQVTDFLPDVSVFQSILSQVQADGGGDTPESLNFGLHSAVQNVTWRGADTVKLIFLVADAPPHLDYPDDYDYAQEMFVAAQKGIKIHPIASSGLPPEGEFIFRQLAEVTMGHFLFLTYDQAVSGVPGDSRPDLQVGEPANPANQQQGDYTVEHLDELVLRLINDELTASSRPAALNGVRPQLLGASTYPATIFPTVEVARPTPTPLSDAEILVTSPSEEGVLIPTYLLTVQPTVPSPVQDTTSQSESVRNAILIALLLVVIGAFLVGLIVAPMLPGRNPPRRKRKNDEDEIVEPDD